MSGRKWAIAGGVVGLALAWWFFSRPGTDYANYPPNATGPWVAFGDSLTAGFGASEANGYPAVLGRKLGVEIQNLGRSGETSADGLRRVEDVALLKPRVVLLCFGGNDSLNQESRAGTFANLGRKDRAGGAA